MERDVLLSPYQGSEPYIFISYAHKDSAVVLPILQRMQECGFRVWYDEGIEGGVEWPEYIALKLFSSGCVVAFISRNAVNSKNCRREINFAIDKDKPLLVVYLDNEELPLGMQLQLNTLQALYCLSAEATEPLLQRLKVTQLLQVALETAEAEPVQVQEATEESPVELEQAEAEPTAVEEIKAAEPAAAEEAETAEPTVIEEPKLPTPPKQIKEQVMWRCTCGRENPWDVPKCSCGNWHCSCGRIHASYESGCICGLDKWGEKRAKAAVTEEPPKQEIPKSHWCCTCGKENSLDVRKCSCGNWHCTCGRIHASYVSSCVCGKRKNG